MAFHNYRVDNTYKFTGKTVDGVQHEVAVSARNMGVAVAKFMLTANKPAAMRWYVRAPYGKKLHPVTRERWGHFFDGKTTP